MFYEFKFKSNPSEFVRGILCECVCVYVCVCTCTCERMKFCRGNRSCDDISNKFNDFNILPF